MHTWKIGRCFSQITWVALAGLAIGLVGPAPARAGLIVTVGSAAAAAGSTNDFLDVILQNTGPSAVTVDAFTFLFTTSNTFVTFTSANISTVSTYIFAGNSLLGPTISIPSEPNAQTMNAGDVANVGNGTVIASGATLGLGHVLFNVAGNASAGLASLVLDTSTLGTSLSDSAGNLIPITTENNGQINITASASPEPSTFVPLALLLVTAAGARLRRKVAA